METGRRIISIDEIVKLTCGNAENVFSHNNTDDESRRFRYLLNGDIRAVDEADKLMGPEVKGKFSEDSLRNMKYLFVVNTGLASRCMIEAGIPKDTVRSISDDYIRKADVAGSVKEIHAINREVWTAFVDTVRTFKKERAYSKTVWICLNYIDSHFTEKITLDSVAGSLGMSSSYLATVFKRETGKTFLGCLTEKRIEVSKALLSKTNYSFADIACSLSFCSKSHFAKIFKKYTGYTPMEYRIKFYNTDLRGGSRVI